MIHERAPGESGANLNRVRFLRYQSEYFIHSLQRGSSLWTAMACYIHLYMDGLISFMLSHYYRDHKSIATCSSVTGWLLEFIFWRQSDVPIYNDNVYCLVSRIVSVLLTFCYEFIINDFIVGHLRCWSCDTALRWSRMIDMCGLCCLGYT